jgi:Icc-related predicted phosphoesterase
MLLRQYSDLHLDSYWIPGHHNGTFFEPAHWGELWYPPFRADDKETTLLLTGDIWIGSHFIFSNGTSWIQGVAKRFKQVLIVLGNHDYWACKEYLTIKDGAKKCNDRLAQMGIFNVKVLDCDTYQDENVLFVGCTLWTDLNKQEPLTVFNLPGYMRDADMTAIYEEGNVDKMWPSEIPHASGFSRFTPERWLETHDRHKAYLKLIFEQNRDKEIIVLTHHVPLLTLSNPAFPPTFVSGYYASDLSELILDNHHVKYWFHGHSHFQHETTLGETMIINNCVGYKNQNFERLGLVKHKIIEI